MLDVDQIEEVTDEAGNGPPVVAPAVRSLIFVSHAAPEDNEFSRWVATQLAIAGYEVWCDVTKLLGGEAFWIDIEQAIDARAFRFLFVSTLKANTKPGTLRELKLALAAQQKYSIRDFVVPLKVDAFPFQSMQKPLGDLNCVRFDENWADGLKQLLELLERAEAPKSLRAGPSCVADWYERTRNPNRKIVVSNSVCHSNWYSLTFPEQVYAHVFAGPAEIIQERAVALDFPHRIHGRYIISFAPLVEFESRFGSSADFATAASFSPSAFMQEGSKALGLAADDSFRIVSDLVRQTWEAAMDARGLRSFLLSGDIRARFFAADQLEKNRAYLPPRPGERQKYRQLVGKKSKRTLEGEKVPDGFWHYALSVSVQLLPFPRLALRHHVLFTDDGQTPWNDADRMHKARRSVCKNWWNAEWRDRLLAFVAALESGSEMRLPAGNDAFITVAVKPLRFTSPWTFYEGKDPALDESSEIELIEEPDEDYDEEGSDDSA